MKKIVAFFFSLLVLLIAPPAVLAQDPGLGIQPGEALNSQTFDALNPLVQAGDPAVTATIQTPAGIINRVLIFAFPIAGLILFLMILVGGFEMISGATSKKSMDQGKQRITSAVIGFGILFVAYWLVKLVEAMFGVKIL